MTSLYVDNFVYVQNWCFRRYKLNLYFLKGDAQHVIHIRDRVWWNKKLPVKKQEYQFLKKKLKLPLHWEKNVYRIHFRNPILWSVSTEYLFSYDSRRKSDNIIVNDMNIDSFLIDLQNVVLIQTHREYSTLYSTYIKFCCRKTVLSNSESVYKE